MSEKRTFEFVEGSSAKFWEIWHEGSEVMTRYGRFGAGGQTTVKDEGDAANARKLYERLVTEKTRKGYVEKSAFPSPVKAEGKAVAKKNGPTAQKKSAGAATQPHRTAKWTTATRKLLHGFSAPDKSDPPDVVMSIDDAWKHLVARYQHLVTVTLEDGAAPTGTGEMKAVVDEVVASFAKDEPPAKLDLREELCRAAMIHMTEGGWGARGQDRWESWSYARALVSLWLERAGLEFVFEVLNHPPLFRLTSDGRNPAEGNGSFDSHGFSKTAKERESNRYTAHPRALVFDVPSFPVVVGRFHDDSEATAKGPVGEREWYRLNKKRVTTPDGGTITLNDSFFFYVVQPASYLWALRSRMALLPQSELVASHQQWKKKAPLRDDPEDAATAFVFSRDNAVVSPAVVRALKAKDPGPLAMLLFPIASAAEALQLAGKHLADCDYALDLVDRLDDKAAPVLKKLVAKNDGYIAGRWKNALKLL